jgi:hypothetical protein
MPRLPIDECSAAFLLKGSSIQSKKLLTFIDFERSHSRGPDVNPPVADHRVDPVGGYQSKWSERGTHINWRETVSRVTVSNFGTNITQRLNNTLSFVNWTEPRGILPVSLSTGVYSRVIPVSAGRVGSFSVLYPPLLSARNSSWRAINLSRDSTRFQSGQLKVPSRGQEIPAYRITLGSFPEWKADAEWSTYVCPSISSLWLATFQLYCTDIFSPTQGIYLNRNIFHRYRSTNYLERI